MSRFAIRNPYFIVVVCLIIAVVGVTSPMVVVASFYSGMPPEQIDTGITSRFERFFLLGSGIESIESRSLPGVSVRATVVVFLSIPLPALAAFIALSVGGSSIDDTAPGGPALAFSRLIDNSVVVLENIYRHLELGEAPAGEVH